MKVKASLHIHTKEDVRDGHFIKYNIYKLINKARSFDFKVIAITGHEKYLFTEDHFNYAEKKGILLIPGIELSLDNIFFKCSHIIVLNCKKEVEKIKTIAELKKYKTKHPEIFIFPPHPNYGFFESIGIQKLIENISLFDAIEHSWFYSKQFNWNKDVKKIARAYNLPFIATSDAHTLEYLNTDYLMIDINKLTKEDIFRAIKNKKYKNITAPKKFIKLIIYFISILFKYFLLKPIKF